MSRILVIDDEPGICRAFEKFLMAEGHEVRTSSRAETGLTLAEAFEPDLVILDVRLPGMSGLEALVRLREMNEELPVIVVTAYGTMETAVTAMRRGAYDYLLKPLDLGRITEVMGRALKSRKQKSEVVLSGGKGETSLVGRSPAMQEVFKKIGAVSLSGVPVLLVGESGTGKERVARAIHYASARAEEPFEKVSCASIPEERLEEEIFGPAAGRFKTARGGTLYLEDVEALAPAVQVSLLRGLEEIGEFDVRMISATSASLAGAVGAGRFREDLFYSLNVVTIRVPPLRERLADLPALASHFLAGQSAAVSKEALRALLTHSWPGNVRELRNAVEHAVVLSRGGTILKEHLPDRVREGAEQRPREDEAVIRRIVTAAVEAALDEDDDEGRVHQDLMERFEAPLIAAVIEKTGGNQVRAARILGIHRTTLRGKMQKYSL